MYLQENFIVLTRGHVKQQNFLGTCPYHFPHGNGLHLAPTKESWFTKKLGKVKLHLAIYNCIVLWCQLLFEVMGGRVATVGTKLANYFYSLTVSTIHLQKWVTLKHSAKTIELFNLFVVFESNYLIGKKC